MLNRLFALTFILVILGGPVAGVLSFTDSARASSESLKQRSMCLATGVGCGSGHVLLPALGRM
ncbi:MAG: sugar transporter [Roseibium sp.]|nr:sugar transporter [Roseibium sp.]